MKFLVKNNPTNQVGIGERDRPVTQASYELPNSTITWLSIIYLVVQTLGTSVGSSTSNYFSNKPQRDIDNKTFTLKEQNFKIQLLQKCLELDSSKDRKLSLTLLINTDIFSENEKKQLSTYIEVNKEYLPKWKIRNIETLNTYLNTSSSSYYTVPATQPSSSGSGTLGTTTPSTGGSTPR